MRNLKNVGIALGFLVSSIALVSCSDDENGDDHQQLVVKQVTSIVVNRMDDTTRLTDFNYDKEGRILSYKIDGALISYEYGANSIIVSSESSDDKITYIIREGHIISYSDGYYDSKFTYSDNKLIRYTESYDGIICDFEWEKGLKGFNYKDSYYEQEENITYDYGNIKCLSQLIFCYVDDTPFDGFDVDPFLAMQGYYGDPFFVMLPNSYTLEHSDDRVWGSNFKYEFDSDGYVISMTVDGFGTELGQKESFTFTWK